MYIVNITSPKRVKGFSTFYGNDLVCSSKDISNKEECLKLWGEWNEIIKKYAHLNS